MAVSTVVAWVLVQMVAGPPWRIGDLPYPILLAPHPELDGDAPIARQPRVVYPGYEYASQLRSNTESLRPSVSPFLPVSQEQPGVDDSRRYSAENNGGQLPGPPHAELEPQTIKNLDLTSSQTLNQGLSLSAASLDSPILTTDDRRRYGADLIRNPSQRSTTNIASSEKSAESQPREQRRSSDHVLCPCPCGSGVLVHLNYAQKEIPDLLNCERNFIGLQTDDFKATYFNQGDLGEFSDHAVRLPSVESSTDLMEDSVGDQTSHNVRWLTSGLSEQLNDCNIVAVSDRVDIPTNPAIQYTSRASALNHQTLCISSAPSPQYAEQMQFQHSPSEGPLASQQHLLSGYQSVNHFNSNSRILNQEAFTPVVERDAVSSRSLRTHQPSQTSGRAFSITSQFGSHPVGQHIPDPGSLFHVPSSQRSKTYLDPETSYQDRIPLSQSLKKYQHSKVSLYRQEKLSTETEQAQRTSSQHLPISYPAQVYESQRISCTTKNSAQISRHFEQTESPAPDTWNHVQAPKSRSSNTDYSPVLEDLYQPDRKRLPRSERPHDQGSELGFQEKEEEETAMTLLSLENRCLSSEVSRRHQPPRSSHFEDLCQHPGLGLVNAQQKATLQCSELYPDLGSGDSFPIQASVSQAFPPEPDFPRRSPTPSASSLPFQASRPNIVSSDSPPITSQLSQGPVLSDALRNIGSFNYRPIASRLSKSARFLPPVMSDAREDVDPATSHLSQSARFYPPVTSGAQQDVDHANCQPITSHFSQSARFGHLVESGSSKSRISRSASVHSIPAYLSDKGEIVIGPPDPQTAKRTATCIGDVVWDSKIGAVMLAEIIPAHSGPMLVPSGSDVRHRSKMEYIYIPVATRFYYMALHGPLNEDQQNEAREYPGQIPNSTYFGSQSMRVGRMPDERTQDRTSRSEWHAQKAKSKQHVLLEDSSSISMSTDWGEQDFVKQKKDKRWQFLRSFTKKKSRSMTRPDRIDE